MILEILLILLMFAIAVFVWIKTRSLHRGLQVFALFLPTLEKLAVSTDNKIDDKAVAYLKKLLNYVEPVESSPDKDDEDVPPAS